MAPFLKILCFCTLSSFAVSQSLFAQQSIPHIEWARSFGGSDIDQAYCIEQTSDKGYIIAGSSYSNDLDIVGHHGSTDSADYWIVKLDSNGNLEWQRSLGGAGEDVANCIKQTPDGGYIVAGYSSSKNGDVSGNHGGYDYWIVKLDDNGKILWQKSYGGTNDDKAYSIIQTQDSGFLAIGSTNSNDGDVSKTGSDTLKSGRCWIVKLDSNGSLLWEKILGNYLVENTYSVKQTSDHGYIIAGQEDFSYWIIKIDNQSNLLWQKSFGGINDDVAYSIDLTSDGGLIVAGYSSSSDGEVTGNHGNADYWILKLDNNGNLKWERSFGGSDADAAYSIMQTLDHGFIVAGYSASNDGDVTGNHGGNDYWIVKLDSLGSLLWQESLGGPGEDFALCIRQTADSGYVIAGSSDFDGGDVSGNHNHEDYWILKLGTLAKNEVSFSEGSSKIGLNYPNPFSDRTTVQLDGIGTAGTSLVVYNLLGIQLRKINIPEGSKTVSLERKGLASGVYVYHIMSQGVITAKGTLVVQ
jgi:hypothetical protein